MALTYIGSITDLTQKPDRVIEVKQVGPRKWAAGYVVSRSHNPDDTCEDMVLCWAYGIDPGHAVAMLQGKE